MQQRQVKYTHIKKSIRIRRFLNEMNTDLLTLVNNLKRFTKLAGVSHSMDDIHELLNIYQELMINTDDLASKVQEFQKIFFYFATGDIKSFENIRKTMKKKRKFIIPLLNNIMHNKKFSKEKEIEFL